MIVVLAMRKFSSVVLTIIPLGVCVAAAATKGGVVYELSPANGRYEYTYTLTNQPEADGVNGDAWRAVKRSPVSIARRAQKPASP
jgi:hypothetical protein